MTEAIIRKELLHTNGKDKGDWSGNLLLGKYRVRLFKTADVPLLANGSFLLNHPRIVVIDMLAAEMSEKKVKGEKEIADQQTGYSTDSGIFADGPLEFDFLSLSKLEQRCAANDEGFRERPLICSTSYFECNPLNAPMAFDLRNRLMRRKLPALLDKSLLDKPICIVANAEDQLGTTFVGFHYSGPKLTTFHTRYLGRYGDHCESELRSLHQRFEGLESQRKAVASYNILDESSVFGANKFPSKMKLTFKWNEKPEDYLSPPPPSASALFHFSPGWKDKRVVLFETTEQLEYLLLMADVLDSKSVMVWPKAGENSSENVLNEVRSLIAQYRVQSNNAERTSREMRHVDFTELLWDILSKCGNYETLVASLKLVFDALEGSRINAVLHDDNKSIMARLIHDSQSGNLMLPRLEALTPVQILLEIGIERFKRDMVQAYITAGLLTSDTDLDLKFKINPRPQERARALLPVHLALQTMLEIKRHLNVPSHMLTKMTRLVVDKYCSTPVTDITKVFYETTVPRIQVHNDLFLKLPNLWTYEATYSCANSTVAHISVTFTRKPQLRFIEDKVLAETEITDAEDFDKRTAFLCTYTTYSCLNIEDCDGLD